MLKKPLIGYVAYNASLFTMHYKREGNIGGIARQGYDISIFDEAEDDTPIVRFDLSPADAVLYIAMTNREYYDPLGSKTVGDTKDEVKAWKRRHVKVQTYKEFLAEVKDANS